MSIKILTKNSIDNTNIDGARQNHFSAGMRSGIVKGAFNEGRFFASASNVIALDTCELRISGHQIIIDSLEAITLNDRPTTPTKYSMIAEIQVSDTSVPSFRLFIQPANVVLRQENLFKTNNGSGTYQLRIGNFTINTDGNITDVFRTTDIITGGNGAVSDIVFNASAIKLSADSEPEANVDYNEETGEYDFVVGIPVGSGEDNTDLTNYYTKDETYSKEEIDTKLEELEPNVDLSDYYTKTEVDDKISGIEGGSSIVVDSELSSTSENPVQNKVITEALNNRYTKDEVDTLISGTKKRKNLYGGHFQDLKDVYGITFVDNGDGSFTINGKQSSTQNPSIRYLYAFNNWTDFVSPLKLKAGTYTFGLCNDVENTGLSIFMLGSDRKNYEASVGNPVTFTITTDITFEVFLQVATTSTYTFNNFIAYPMLVEGTELVEWEATYEDDIQYLKQYPIQATLQLQADTTANGTQTIPFDKITHLNNSNDFIFFDSSNNRVSFSNKVKRVKVYGAINFKDLSSSADITLYKNTTSVYNSLTNAIAFDETRGVCLVQSPTINVSGGDYITIEAYSGNSYTIGCYYTTIIVVEVFLW